MNRSFFMVALAASLVSALSGQSLTGPTQGIVFDIPSASLRPVVGSYGSAVLGPAILSDLDFGSAAPQRTRGIACEQGQCFFVSGLGSDAGDKTPIVDQIDMPEGAAWSADGQVAAIYSRSGQWIRVLRMSGESGAQQNISSLDGRLVAVEVSPDGNRITFAIAGDHSGVYELRENGALVPVLASENPMDLAYAADGKTLYVLDGSQLSAVDANGIAQSWPLEAVQDGVALQPGQDASGRNVLYVAGRGDHALFVYDIGTHALLEQIALSFAPTQMQTSGAGNYLLTSRNSEDELLWAFAAGRGAFFVPVTPAVTTNGHPTRKVRR